MQLRLFLAVAILGVIPAIGFAVPLDPQTRDAYRWQVVIAAGRHPVLTPAFRDRLARELRAALQGAVGPVADVEMIDLAAVPRDRWDPLWQQFAEKGWPALDPDYRYGREITGLKTHFLRVEYHDGRFHLEAKQFDGSTGLPTPVLRKQAVRSADLVARVAGLLIEPDFCPTGTVTINPDDVEYVTVALRGSAIGSLDRYVRLGRVFAVSVLRDPPKAGRGKLPTNAPTGLAGGPTQITEYTLLKVIDPIRDGSCRCQVLNRWQRPFGDLRRAVGVRCLLLPTMDAPVQLRLVDKDGTPHPRGSLVQVAATDTDFAARPGPQDNFEFRDGVYRSGRSFAQVACVQIALGAGNPQLIPVPVLGGDPVTIRFEIRPEDEERATFERACDDLRGRVADALLAQAALFTELNRLIGAGQNREALARAEAGHAATEHAVKALAEELKQTQEDPKAKDKVAAGILKLAEERLATVRESQKNLATRVVNLKEAAKKSADPIRVMKELQEKDLADRIREYVTRGDVDDALRAYDELITLRPNQQDLKDQRERLQTEWAPKDEEHRKARESFIAWTKAKTATDYKEAIVPLHAATEVFLRKRDRLGLRKLLNLLDPAAVSIKVLMDAADTNTEDGQRALKDLESVVAELRQTEQEAREFLKKLSEK